MLKLLYREYRTENKEKGYKQLFNSLKVYERKEDIDGDDLKPVVVAVDGEIYICDYYNYCNIPNNVYHIVDRVLQERRKKILTLLFDN